jgi:hypothetical protein
MQCPFTIHVLHIFKGHLDPYTVIYYPCTSTTHSWTTGGAGGGALRNEALVPPKLGPRGKNSAEEVGSLPRKTAELHPLISIWDQQKIIF